MITTSIQDELYAIDTAMLRPLDTVADYELLIDLGHALDKLHWAWDCRHGLGDDPEDEFGDWGQPSATLDGLVMILDEQVQTKE